MILIRKVLIFLGLIFFIEHIYLAIHTSWAHFTGGKSNLSALFGYTWDSNLYFKQIPLYILLVGVIILTQRMLRELRYWPWVISFGIAVAIIYTMNPVGVWFYDPSPGGLLFYYAFTWLPLILIAVITASIFKVLGKKNSVAN